MLSTQLVVSVTVMTRKMMSSTIWIRWKTRKKMTTTIFTGTWPEGSRVRELLHIPPQNDIYFFAESLDLSQIWRTREFQYLKSHMPNEEIKLTISQTIMLQVFWEKTRKRRSSNWHGMPTGRLLAAEGIYSLVLLSYKSTKLYPVSFISENFMTGARIEIKMLVIITIDFKSNKVGLLSRLLQFITSLKILDQKPSQS